MARLYVQVLSEVTPEQFIWIALSSAMSARVCDPDAHTVLLIDAVSLRCLPQPARQATEATFSKVIAVEVPYQPGALASRHLKTSMRSLVSGDFLFLDIDTLMFATPLEMFSGDHDLGAAHDRNHKMLRPHKPSWVVAHYQALGWDFAKIGYFNTGVLFMRDNARTREYSTQWHERWNHFLKSTGKHQDQPSFNSLISSGPARLKPFSLRYNAMVNALPFFCWKAHIVHYFLLGGRRLNPADSLLSSLANEWRESGSFNLGLFEAHRRQRDPWMHPTNSIQIELACGHFQNAVKLVISRL